MVRHPKGSQGQLKESRECTNEWGWGEGEEQARRRETEYLGGGVVNWRGDQEGLAL